MEDQEKKGCGESGTVRNLCKTEGRRMWTSDERTVWDRCERTVPCRWEQRQECSGSGAGMSAGDTERVADGGSRGRAAGCDDFTCC